MGKVDKDEKIAVEDWLREIKQEKKKEHIEKRRVTTMAVIYMFAIGAIPILGLIAGGPIGLIIGIVLDIVIYRFLFPHDNSYSP